MQTPNKNKVKKKRRNSIIPNSPLKQWSMIRNFEKFRFRGIMVTLSSLSTLTENEKKEIKKVLKILSKIDIYWDAEREIAKADFLRGGK
jgi:hypothetical protein